MAYARVYSSNDGVNCVPTTLVQNPITGEVSRAAITNNMQTSVANACAQGGLVYPANAFGGNRGLSLGNTIRPAETVQGSVINFREETSGGVPAVMLKWTTTLVNSGAAAVVVPFGDANKCIELGKSLPAIPVTIAVTGTFGANSLAQFKLISGHNPLRIQTTRVSASTQPVLASAALELVTSDVVGNLTSRNLNLATWLTPDQLNTSLVENKDVRALVDGQTAFLLTVPVGTLTITFDVVSAGTSYGMVKTS
jgi:hypothetical protein